MKTYVLRIWVYSTVLNKKKPATMHFLKKTSLVIVIILLGCSCADPSSGICYYTSTVELTRDDAQASCQADGAQLALIKTSTIQNLVTTCGILTG